MGSRPSQRSPAVVGQGEVFERYQYNAWYAAAVLAGILAMLGFVSRRAGVAAEQPSLATPRSGQ